MGASVTEVSVGREVRNKYQVVRSSGQVRVRSSGQVSRMVRK